MFFNFIPVIMIVCITQIHCIKKTSILMEYIDGVTYKCPCGCFIVTSKGSQLILKKLDSACQASPTSVIFNYKIECPCGCQGTLKNKDEFYIPAIPSCTLTSYAIINNEKRLCPCGCLNNKQSEIKYLIHKSPFCPDGQNLIKPVTLLPTASSSAINELTTANTDKKTSINSEDSTNSNIIPNNTPESSDSKGSNNNSPIDTSSDDLKTDSGLLEDSDTESSDSDSSDSSDSSNSTDSESSLSEAFSETSKVIPAIPNISKNINLSPLKLSNPITTLNEPPNSKNQASMKTTLSSNLKFNSTKINETRVNSTGTSTNFLNPVKINLKKPTTSNANKSEISSNPSDLSKPQKHINFPSNSDKTSTKTNALANQLTPSLSNSS